MALPVTAAVTWALFVSPKAAFSLPEPMQIAAQIVLLSAAVGLLLAARQQILALGFALLAVANASLIAWGQ